MPSNDNTKTFSLLEQPCALRGRDEPKELRRKGTAYDLAPEDSDYDAAQRATGTTANRKATTDSLSKPGKQGHDGTRGGRRSEG